MKIIITSTPEYSQTELQEVVNVLNQQKGFISFELGETLSEKQFNKISSKYNEFLNHGCFSFDELFDLTEQYRTIKDISEDDYLVLITSYRNQHNWFSAFRDKDIFVDSNDWEYFSKKDGKYGIAFQIVENLLQGFMKLDINNPKNEPNIHFESIGCLNDFCGNKKDVMFKLRQGYLCNTCIDRLEEEGANMSIVAELMQTINFIRDEMVNKFRLLANKQETKPIEIDDKGNIKIGEKLIELPAQRKSVYFLFLNYLNGIESRRLDEYIDSAFKIYQKVKGRGAMVEKIQKVFIRDYSNQFGRFLLEKTNINKKLNQTLGSKLSENYIIDYKNKEAVFKVNLEEEEIKISNDFKIS